MMDTKRYLEVLNSRLELFRTKHGTAYSLHFLSQVKKVTEWFQARPNITLIKWHGNSPDLNPIENVWSWMKNQLGKTSYKTLDEWVEEIKGLWYGKMKDSDYLTESMPRRLELVRQHGGGGGGRGINKYWVVVLEDYHEI